MRSLETGILASLLLVATVLDGCATSELDDPGEPSADVTSALASDCTGGRNGFVDIPDNQSGTVSRLFTVRDNESGGPARITQESAFIANATRGYAKISGQTRTGDQLWMDWEENTSPPIRVQCGPFTVTTNGQSITTAAKQTSGSQRRFRACARPVNSNVSICNNWW